MPLVATLLLTAGCSPTGDDAGGAEAARDLTFEYFGVADSGMIDQTLTIQNDSADAVTLTVSLVALDNAGNPLETVRVGTVYGSDRGLVTAPARFEVFDILTFNGVGADRVADVDVQVQSVRTSDDRGMAYPALEYLDAHDQIVPTPDLAKKVQIQNSGSQDIVVRLVGIEWNMPSPGRSQQALRVTSVGEPVVVPAHNATSVAVPLNMQGTFDSLKGYLSTE